MKKLTTKLTIAATVLVAAASVASAQMTAQIPFEFRVGNRVMAPGAYRVDSLETGSDTKVFRILDVHSQQSVAILPQARVDPQQAWRAGGNPKLLFACTSGRCALAQLWSGSESYAYQFAGPKLGKDEEAILRVIPMQRDKAE